MMDKPDVEFEQALARLEEIVNMLDVGDKPLKESLALYQEGVVLAHECSRLLDEAKSRLEVLARNGNGTSCTEEIEL
jgi:exodeoxyribonuclease VII small subunit